MNFNLYNILSQLVPGFVLFTVGIYILNLDINTIPELPSIAIAYLLGYLINAIGGWTEKTFYWTWGEDPAIQLLKGKKCGRIKLYEIDKIKNLIKKGKEISDKELFQIAMRISNNEVRVNNMNSSYIFSRSILITFILSYLILTTSYLNSYIIFHTISILIILMSWYRLKERAFYYAKEVLLTSINKLENS